MTAKRDKLESEPANILVRVADAIAKRKLTTKAAATEIGVTTNTLERHLLGEHVRSDSARKYQDWLAGRAGRRRVFRQSEARKQIGLPFPVEGEAEAEVLLPPPPHRPHLVVDIFSGCGGLSLGFDLVGKGTHFRTVLAMDVVSATVAVMNRNHEIVHGAVGVATARVADLTEFLNETEVLTFYLDHVIRLHQDTQTRGRLDSIAGGSFAHFLKALRSVDNEFLDEMADVRGTRTYRAAFDALDKGVLGQTSVVGFQDALKLPRVTRARPSLPPVLWSDVAAAGAGSPNARGHLPVPADFISEAHILWERELAALEAKQKASGKGQLTSAARRISAFATFARSGAFSGVRKAWCRWQAARLALRAETFQNAEFEEALRRLYDETYPVSVLLGGPPCQGFSRIGRGKIRSLREAHIHVHGNAEAGDARNFLYQRYLLVVSALRPLAFQFENVQHFQSAVKTEGRQFLATEILADAIAELSEGGVSYAVASRTLDASRHGVPQTRQRFFMSGLRRDAFPSDQIDVLAARCIALPTETEVLLSSALEGLPEPELVGGDLPAVDAMSAVIPLEDHPDPQPTTAAARYRAWIRQPDPRAPNAPARTDAHAARATREDDAALFALFGPGKRWMDYRVDAAPTLAALKDTLQALASLPAAAHAKAARALPKDSPELPPAELALELLSRLDGSLVLRLLMEQIGEKLDAPHHLATLTYLSKRDGNHGDWLTRLDGMRPCRTVVAHMGKDTYGYVHPALPRTLSVREAARVQTFPDWFSFAGVALTDALKMIGNAVPPLLSHRIASRVAAALARRGTAIQKLNEAA